MSDGLGLGQAPSPPPTKDLGRVFGRADGLRNRLAPKVSPNPAPTASQAPEVHTDPERQARPVKPGGGEKTRPRRRRTAGPEEILRPIIAYIPASVQGRLRAARRDREGSTYTELVLDAVEQTHDDLPDLLEDREPPPRPSALFVRESQPVPAEPHVQINLRTTAGNLAVLDQLVDEFRAGNRSRLISTALDAYLPKSLNP